MTFGTRVFIPTVVVLLAALPAPAQLMTPSRAFNEELQGRSIGDIPMFGTSSDTEGRLVVNPDLPTRGWHWIAGRDVEHGGERFSFFVYDGYIYATQQPKGKYRPLVGRDVSDEVRSNAFHIALASEPGTPREKDNEYILFVATDEPKKVSVTLSASLLGHDEVIDLELGSGEARLFRIVDARHIAERYPLYAPLSTPVRSSIPLDDGWLFHKGDAAGSESPQFDDSGWSTVVIPHSWNATDVFDNRNINSSVDIYSDYWRGAGWYRRSVLNPPVTDGKRVLLSFDGANQVTDVWVNGTLVGSHVGGYTGFSFDITDELVPGGIDLVAVRVDNSYNYDILPHIADFDMSGGITREVQLDVVPDVRVLTAFATTPSVSAEQATVRLATEIVNQRTLPVTARIVSSIVNPTGFVVASSEATLELPAGISRQVEQSFGAISRPELWSPDRPSLYRAIIHVWEGNELIDVYESPLGFRWFAFDPAKGFYLNGERLQLRGVNLHQDRYGFGPAVTDSLRIQDLKMVKQMGANFVRLAHYPHDPVMLDAADRLGLIIWAEIPFVNTVGREQFIENAKTMLREMIRRDRNHPSIVFWGIANETHSEWLADEDLIYVERALRELNRTVKEEDPTRFSAQAQNAIADTTIIGITDVIGRNRYFGWYSAGIENFGLSMDIEHRAHPDWRVIITEYGAGAKRGYHVENPQRFDFSESYQVEFHEGILDQIEEREWLAGGAVWNQFDFASQNKIGSIPRINQKGLGDYSRRPKDAFYFYQSRWSDKPMVYIVSHTWDYRKGHVGETKCIRVFSNMPEVELISNGATKGVQTTSFEWDVSLSEGVNHLVAVGRNPLMGQTVVDTMEVYYDAEDTDP